MAESKSTRESLSKTPSWIMLGFVIGCVVMWTIRKETLYADKEEILAKAQYEAAHPKPTPTPPPPQTRMSLSDMEAIFEEWQGSAVWQFDTTEVVFWNRESNQFIECVQVLKNGDDLFFRTIPKLTRPLIDDGVPKNAPIRFTEPEDVHAERRTRFMIPSR